MPKNMQVLNRQFLGSGAHWEVHSLTLAEPGYAVNGKHHVRLAQKVGGPLDFNIEYYQKCKRAGIPTLDFFEAACIEGEPCVLCEDLSMRERLYVSPNTARRWPSTRDRLLEILLRGGERKAALQSGQKRSLAEAHLAQNKLIRVTNLEDLMQQMSREALKASKAGIGFCEDMFFFGTDRSTETELDMLVADFDTILPLGKDVATHHNDLANEKVGLTAIWEFFEHFVENGKHRTECQALLESTVEQCAARLDRLEDE